MSQNYDNWERLVRVVLRRENDRQLAFKSESSTPSDTSSSSGGSDFDHDIGHDQYSLVHRQIRSEIPMDYFDLILSHSEWKAMLPPDKHEIVFRSASLSFSLEKRSGKKCYMVGARELIISWGDNPSFWEWISYAESRFSEVAQLINECWLDIRGKIKTQMLSPNTTYGAYLVFKLTERCYGLELANAVVRFVDNEADNDAEKRAITVHLQQANARNGAQRQTGQVPMRILNVQNGAEQQTEQVPVRRSDGWMEIELGNFYNDEGYDGEVEARLIEIKRLYGKPGPIVEGIEFRPKTQFGST